MTEFLDQDLSGARFERVKFIGAHLRRVNFSDAEIRGAAFYRTRMIGIEMSDAELTGEFVNVTVNGVDIGPLVEAELNRRMPDRAKMRPDDVEGFKDAWATLTRLWEGTVGHARSLPETALNERVDGEWSFIQTLRHLNFATAAWVGRMIRGNSMPWDPLDLPWEEAPDWPEIPLDRQARPSLDAVLEVRRRRQELVSGVIDQLTPEQLASTVSQTAPGWPRAEAFAFKDCLLVVLNEEWEHRLYAERDLAKLEAART
jgi:hypothetical protein